MGMLGGWEIAAIAAVALLIFGPRKLPELARSIGGAINEFRSTMASGAKSSDEDEPKKIGTGTTEEDKTEEKPAG